jgi:hypothetical protein
LVTAAGAAVAVDDLVPPIVMITGFLGAGASPAAEPEAGADSFAFAAAYAQTQGV